MNLFEKVKRDDVLTLSFDSECVMRFDSSYPTKNALGAELPCEFIDVEGNLYEIPNLKISVTLKNKERLIFFTSATEIFHALRYNEKLLKNEKS